jgi:hypothetical protein
MLDENAIRNEIAALEIAIKESSNDQLAALGCIARDALQWVLGGVPETAPSGILKAAQNAPPFPFSVKVPDSEHLDFKKQGAKLGRAFCDALNRGVLEQEREREERERRKQKKRQR